MIKVSFMARFELLNPKDSNILQLSNKMDYNNITMHLDYIYK